jgi:hypothetical protein
VADATPGRAFGVSATCAFGTGGLAQVFAGDHVLESLVSTDAVPSGHVEMAKASVALSGLSAVLRTAAVVGGNGASRLGISSTKAVSANALKRQVQEIGVMASPVLDVLATAAAEQARDSDHTLWPAPGVALQLYKELEGGRLAGYRLLYQRVLGDGAVLASEFLTFRPALH